MDNGTYRAKAQSWGLGKTSTNKEQVGVEFALFPGQETGGQQTVVWYGFFTDAAIDSTIKALRTMGWEGADLSALTGLDANEVDLVIENEEYQGKTTPKVRWVNAVGAGAMMRSSLSADEAASFAARMRGRILAADKAAARPAAKPSGAKPASDRRPEPPPPGDLDIPF